MRKYKILVSVFLFIFNVLSLSGEEFVVFDLQDTEYEYLNYPSAAMNKDGIFIITWNVVDKIENSKNWIDDVYVSRFNSSGEPSFEPMKINTYSEGSYPEIAIAETGYYVIAWVNRTEKKIYARLFDNSGEPMDAEFQVNQTIGVYQYNVSIEMDLYGNFLVVWTNEENNAFDIYARKYDMNGSPLTGEYKVNDIPFHSEGACINLEMNSEGDYIIAWFEQKESSKYKSIIAQRFDSFDNKIGDEIQVNPVEHDPSYLSVSLNDNGCFVISWSNEDSYWKGVFAQKYDNDGVKSGNVIQVNEFETYNQKYSSVAMANDYSYLISWASQGQDSKIGGVYSQRFDRNGNKFGKEFRLSNYDNNFWNYNDYSWQYENFSKIYPIVASNKENHHVICWMQEDLIYYSFYNSSTPQIELFPEGESSFGNLNIKLNVEVSNPEVNPVDLYFAIELDGLFYWYPDWSNMAKANMINEQLWYETIFSISYSDLIKDDYYFIGGITEHGNLNILDLDSVTIRIK